MTLPEIQRKQPAKICLLHSHDSKQWQPSKLPAFPSPRVLRGQQGGCQYVAMPRPPPWLWATAHIKLPCLWGAGQTPWSQSTNKLLEYICCLTCSRQYPVENHFPVGVKWWKLQQQHPQWSSTFILINLKPLKSSTHCHQPTTALLWICLEKGAGNCLVLI